MKKSVNQEVSKELIQSFALQIFIFTIILLLISAVGYILCSGIVWQLENPWYPVIHFLHEEWIGVFFFCLFIGCVILTAVHFFRIARMMEQITGAVSDLANHRVSYISLPVQLRGVENQLNHILGQMQRNKLAAEEAEQRKNDMIIYMAHDLKTPLTSVIGYLTLLKEEEEIGDKTREKYLGIALKKAERLEDLINEFFEVTKYNFTHLSMELSDINLSLMLTQMLYEFQPMFAEKGLICRTEIETNRMFRCDVEKMERVFDNLFKNAMNYCYENTEIFISLIADGNNIVISVQNSGKTIPKEKLGHLFEQFFRMDSSRNSGTGGSGLGLAIAKEIITMHHGTITCESENERIVFTIVLPIGRQQECGQQQL